MKKCDVVLNPHNFIPFSFPLNNQYRHSVAISGIQAGIVVAYASKNKIIVLISGRYIASILDGHFCDVCTVSFEKREPHIVSCDVEGNVIFWQFQENTWHNTLLVNLKFPITSIQWCSYRRTICYSSKEGLILTTVQDFGSSGKVIAKKSEDCTFNFDSTLVASHSFGTFVTIVSLKPPMRSEVIRLPAKIILLEFHPLLAIILTYTEDNIMRIWKQSKLGTFSCTASTPVPGPGCFIHMPVFYPEKYTYQSAKVSKIAFLDDNDNIVTLEIGDNGKFKALRPTSIFECDLFKKKRKNPIKAFRTNCGTVAFTFDNNSMNIIHKQKRNGTYSGSCKIGTYLFHSAKIKKAKFSSNSRYLATLDESNMLIVWKLYSVTKDPIIASHDALGFEWLGDETIEFLTKERKIFSLNSKTHKTKEISSHIRDDVEDIFFINSELAYVTKRSIIFKDKELEIGEHERICISEGFEGNKLIVTNNKNLFSAFFVPLMQRVDLDITENFGQIKDVEILSIYEFALLNNEGVHMFAYTRDDKFIKTGVVQINSLDSISSDVTKLGGRLIANNRSDIYSIQNNVEKLASFHDISFIEVSKYGDLCFVSGETFYINSRFSQLQWQERKRYWSARRQPVSNDEVIKPASQVESATLNPLISPEMYFRNREDAKQFSRATLISLLEFSSAYNLENPIPIQTPAFPNQQILQEALTLPDNADNDNIKSLKYIQDINGDYDLYALRYILGIKKSNKPPSFNALWLAFSSSQSQVCDFIADDVELSNMSQMCISACIRDQIVLEKIVKKALSNTWSKYKKPELVALLHIAMGNAKKLAKLYENSGDSARASFFKRDFTQEKNRRSVMKNAYSSLSHHGYDMAAALFIAAGDVSSAIDVILEKLNDPFLALLVLRLKDKSFGGSDMQEFLKKVEWDDELQEAIVAHLIGSGNTCQLLKKYLSKPQRPTQLGDPRIPVYQVLYHLTRSNEMLQCTVHNLLCSGFAPLARYLIEYSKCPYNKPRLTGGKEEVYNEEDCEDENEIVKLLEEHAQRQDSVSDDDAGEFDFGGGGTWGSDDDADWSDYDDDEYDDKYKSEKEHSDEENIEEEEKEGETDREIKFRFINRFIEQRVVSLTALFGTGKDFDAGNFAIHFMHLESGINHLDDDEKNILAKNISIFVDYCSFLFLEGAKIPVTPASLFGLALYIVYIYGDLNTPLTFDSIRSLPQNGFSHSVIFGAFVASVWTFSHHIIAQIFGSKEVNQMVFTPSDLPPPMALFNADINAPMFPDSVPNLIKNYSTGQSLDRDRLLIIILIFNKLSEMSASFTNKRDKTWQSKILNRLMSLMKSLLYFQIAFASPNFDIPEIEEKLDPLTKIIIETHKEKLFYLEHVQNKALSKLATPALFREDKLVFTNNDMKELNFTIPVSSFTISSASRTRAAVVTDKVYIVNPSKMDHHEVKAFDQINLQDTVSVISHPCYELFLLVTKTNAYLFDCNQRDETTFELNISINCAAFNRTGTKIAFGGNELIVASLEIVKAKCTPIIRMNTGMIHSIAWLDNDTKVLVGTETGLLLADLLTGQLSKIVSSEKGMITSICVDEIRQLLVYGTSTGYSAMLSIRKGFEVICVFNMTSSVVSISLLPGLCVVASADGLIVGFNTANPGKTTPYTAPFPITKAIALEDMVIACGRKKLVAWFIH